LISRAMRFEAFVWLFKKRRVVGIEILSPSDLERKQTKTFQNSNPVTSLRFYQQNRFSKLPKKMICPCSLRRGVAPCWRLMRPVLETTAKRLVGTRARMDMNI
jgi:hypothetical protein